MLLDPDSTLQTLQARIEAFKEKRWHLLLQHLNSGSQSNTHGTRSKQNPKALKEKRCKALLRKGQISRAYSTLVSEDTKVAATNILTALQDKHPARTSEVQLLGGRPADQEIGQFDMGVVRAAIRNAKPGTAPGPDGWRFEHYGAYTWRL